MGQSNYDLTIDGTSARILRGESTYRERYVRAEVTQNLLTQAEGASQASRPDQGRLYQTDWSGGSRWWKPIIAGAEQNSYFTSQNFDLWSEPGKVVPRNTFTAVSNASSANWLDRMVAAVVGNQLYIIDSAITDDGVHLDVNKWTPASNNFVAETSYNSGVDSDSDNGPMAAIGDPSDGYIYVITKDSEITRFNPATDAEDDAWIATGFTSSEGANIFLHNGYLMFYSGDQVYTINKSAPSATSVYNDGMGIEALEEAVNNGPAISGGSIYLNLAVSTPEGIYYVKNTRQAGTFVAWVFRVDRDEAGNWIGNPVGSLPTGEVAVDITHHLGSVMISAASDPSAIFNLGTFATTIYHITDGSMGSLGSLEGRLSDNETYRFLGSVGPHLYIGGDNVWVYDAVAGGLHLVLDGALNMLRMYPVTDSASVPCFLFLSPATSASAGRLYKNERTINVDTVTAFGDDETNYVLESNYFDMNLPMEQKDITKVALMVDAASTSSAREWTLQISTDDGSFADVLTHSGTAQYAEATITPATHRGRLFRYKLIYQTKNQQKSACRAVLITSDSGEMVREWEIILDGASLAVAGVEQRPSTFHSAMRTTMVKEQAISVVFDYQDTDVATSLAETVNCKIQFCEIIKDKPDEAKIHLILREV